VGNSYPEATPPIWHDIFLQNIKHIMENFEKTEMSTLTSRTNQLVKEGFTENFTPTHEGIEAPSKGKVYIPNEVKIVNFYRFEGESDPADSAILYAIETNDGTRGLLIDAYGGPYVNQKVGKFIKEVEEIGKKAHTHVGPNSKTEDHDNIDPKERIDQNSNL
jgi:hypothetical protein